MTTKYKVKSTLHHNGAVYQEGSEIELSGIYADPLLAVDVIEPVPVVAEPEQTVKEEVKTDAETDESVKEAESPPEKQEEETKPQKKGKK